MDDFTKTLPLAVSDLWSVLLLSGIIAYVCALAHRELCHSDNLLCKRTFSLVNVTAGVAAVMIQARYLGKFPGVDQVWLVVVSAGVSWNWWLHRERLQELIARLSDKLFVFAGNRAGIPPPTPPTAQTGGK